jgi:hypothetical protein
VKLRYRAKGSCYADEEWSCCEAEEGGAEEKVDGSVRRVPCRARRNEINIRAGQNTRDAQCGCQNFEEDESYWYGEKVERAEPGDYCKSDECGQEESEQQDLTGEPGTAPHLESAPGVGRAAKMEDRDIKGERGEREDKSEGDGAVVM